MIIVLIILWISSFNLCAAERINNSQLEEVRKITRPILNDVMKIYKLNYEFYTEEIVDKVNALHFDFSAQRASNIECARHDIVKITEFVKNKINASNNISCFFNNYPLSEKQIYVCIEYLGNPENKSDFQRVMLIDGRISYSPTYGKTLFREDFNVAKKNCIKQY